MRMGVDGFSCRGGPEKPCNLRQALFIGFFGEGQIFPVGLGFSRKRFVQIFLRFAHWFNLLNPVIR
jgi:hypothetical protein